MITVKMKTKTDSTLKHRKTPRAEDTRRKMQFAWSTEEIFNGTSAILMIIMEFVLLYFSVRFWREGLFTPGDFVLVQTCLNDH